MSVEADMTGLKPLGEAHWSKSALSWTIHLDPDDLVDESAIREVFEFVDGLCELDILGPVPADLPPLIMEANSGNAFPETAAEHNWTQSML